MMREELANDIQWNIPLNTDYPPRTSTPIDHEIALLGKKLIKNYIFYGHYQEKRLVNSLNSHRDLVVIGKNENELINKLDEIKTKFNELYGNKNMWFGLTEPNTIGAPNGYCLWTELESKPFGLYWFCIKRVIVKKQEIFLKIKCLRPYETAGPEKIDNSEPWERIQYDKDDIAKNFLELFEKYKLAINDFVLSFCSIHLTFSNISAVLKIMCLLMVSCCIGAIRFIEGFGKYSLELLEQLTHLIRVLTPTIITALQLLSNIIGGMFIFARMMWKDVVQPPTRHPNTPAIRDSRRVYM